MFPSLTQLQLIHYILDSNGPFTQYMLVGSWVNGEQYATTERRLFLYKFKEVMFVNKYYLNLQAYTCIIIIQGQK